MFLSSIRQWSKMLLNGQDAIETAYCFACKATTEVYQITYIHLENPNRRQLRGVCKVCKTNVARFVKG